ncbi:zinc-binding alcohol dehydrogenase family protein [Gordonia sp. TBRC 11910]|uniref:Zinc-binding alcohol dehydrogenase family protein n=1 Tax=Gordonia asplenii TaxID=2725283 RepID=A0A848KUB2_9ACTN|nr:zinc-binding alcohol dehydrogenase family protein [Gordonia asplenii]NMN99770.1 zinc-binding alcohol dehydrogenase family protein [Gordonia asplenii]
MKAAVVGAAGATPTFTDFADPTVHDGQRVVELVAAGLHPVVRARISGRHYSSENVWPAVPGLDAVARTDDGRLIYTGMVAAPWGTFAERFAVPSSFAVELPDGVDPLAVAAGCNPGLASYVPLTNRRAALGEAGLGTVLILGATGIAGRIAVDNAFALGATKVIAVGRNSEILRELADRRPDSVRTVTLTGTDDAAAIVAALDDQAPTTVIDFVWGPVAEAAFTALDDPALAGPHFDVAHIQIGAIAGAHAAVPATLLRSRRYAISGSGLGSVRPADMFGALPAFIDQIAGGAVHIPFTAYPLAAIDEAWAASESTRAVVVP